MKKSDIRGFIIKYQTKLIQDLEQSINQFHDNADLDEDATKDKEDFSFQDESGEMERRMKEQLGGAKLDLSLVQNISEDACDIVSTGALVETDRNTFYICIATVPFEWEGKNAMGISNKAPIFFKMKGMKAGDEFQIANIKYKILAVS